MHYLFSCKIVIFGNYFYTHPFVYWLGGFVKLFEGICNIITLGTVHFDFYDNFLKFIIKNRCKYRVREK